MLSHRRCSRCDHPHGERGFTLTEMMVVLLILSIIIVPITGAFITSLRATRDVTTTLGNAFDSQLLANYFTSDVQSAEGPSNPEVYAALTADPPIPPEDVDLNEGICGGITNPLTQFPIVTLAWNTTLQGRPLDTLATRVSYVIEGTGKNSILVRRLCEGPDTREIVVAKDFGAEGQEGLELVYGSDPDDPFNSVCDAYSCTINIAGRANYTLRVERRVPGPDAQVRLNQPNPPASVTAESLNESASVTWPASVLSPGQGNVLRYQVYAYFDDPDDPSICRADEVPENIGPSVVGPTVSAGTLQAYVGGLINANGYCFRVRAANAAGWGPLSIPSNVVIPAPSPPPPPLNLTATPGDQSLIVTWDTNPNTGGFDLQGYTVNISPAPNGVTPPITVDPEIEEIRLSCPDSCLINGTTYTVSIAGFNLRGTGPAASVTGRPYGPADPPTNVTARGGGIGAEGVITSLYYKGGVATAQWSQVTGAGLQGGTLWGYRVAAYQVGAAEPAFTRLTAGSVNIGMVGCVTGSQCLVNGRNYEIRVAAVTTTVAGANCATTPASCTLGKESQSAISSAPQGRPAIVPSGPPGAPTNVRLSYVQERDWQFARTVSTWTDVYTPTPGSNPPQPETAAWNGAVPIKYKIQKQEYQQSRVNTGAQPPAGDSGWTGWQDVATIQQSDIYEWLNIQGGYWYRYRVVAINRGEWFRDGQDLDRPGTPSDWSQTQVTSTQPWSNTIYAVTKPDPVPGVNLALVKQLDSGAQGCMQVQRQGATGSYEWETEGPHRNGVKWDYIRIVFRFNVYDRSTGQLILQQPFDEAANLARGHRTFCSTIFRGNRNVQVAMAIASYDAPAESLYDPNLTLNGMIQGYYGSLSNTVPTNG